MKPRPLPPPWDALGMTEGQLAERLHTPRRTVHAWVHGERRPGAAARELIARLFQAHGALDPYRDPAKDWLLILTHPRLGQHVIPFNGNLSDAKRHLSRRHRAAGEGWRAEIIDREGHKYAERAPGATAWETITD